MPKGVDHVLSVLYDDIRRHVQKSLMPKGVDHRVLKSHWTICGLVQKSLMPKGVDHLCGVGDRAARNSAEIFDAERR